MSPTTVETVEPTGGGPMARLRAWFGRPDRGLLRKGIFGLGWTSLGQVVEIVVRLASTVTLTRLLRPEDYGLFGTAMVLVATLEFFSDLGVMPALMREPDGMTPPWLLTGWWIGLFRGMVLTAVGLLMAWPAAHFYGQPALGPVVAGLSFIATAQTLRSPAFFRLHRDMDFRALFLIRAWQTVAGTALTVLLAWLTRSVWSIVVGVLFGNLVMAAMTYRCAPMWPSWAWDRGALASIRRMSGMVMPNTITMALWQNTDRIAGLKVVSLRDMGVYSVAMNLAYVSEVMLLQGGSVYYSMLSQMNGDDARRLAWHERAVKWITLGVVPVLSLGIFLAPPVIWLLYDKRYAAAGLPLAILAGRVIVRFIGQIQAQHLLIQAHVRYTTMAYIFATICQYGLVIYFNTRLGINGLALTALASVAFQAGFQAMLIQMKGERGLFPFLVTLGIVAAALAACVLIYG